MMRNWWTRNVRKITLENILPFQAKTGQKYQVENRVCQRRKKEQIN